MDYSEIEGTIKKLDLRLRQLRLQQRIIQKDADQAALEGRDSRLRRIDRWMVFDAIGGLSVLIIMVVLISLKEGVFFGVGSVLFFAPAILLILIPAFICYRRHRRAVIDAPSRLQKEIDALESELDRQKKLLEGGR